MLSVSQDCLLLIRPSVFSNVYLSCVLCTQCCQCLRIVYYWLHLRFSLTFICPVSCVPNVASVSGLSIVDYTFGFLYRLIVVYPMLSCVFSNVYLSCVLCTQCCQCLRIVYYWLHLRFSLTFICPVSCVPNVASVSGLSIIDYTFGFL